MYLPTWHNLKGLSYGGKRILQHPMHSRMPTSHPIISSSDLGLARNFILDIDSSRARFLVKNGCKVMSWGLGLGLGLGVLILSLVRVWNSKFHINLPSVPTKQFKFLANPGSLPGMMHQLVRIWECLGCCDILSPSYTKPLMCWYTYERPQLNTPCTLGCQPVILLSLVVT